MTAIAIFFVSNFSSSQEETEHCENLLQSLHALRSAFCRSDDFHAEFPTLCTSEWPPDSILEYARSLLSKLLVVCLAHDTELRERL